MPLSKNTITNAYTNETDRPSATKAGLKKSLSEYSLESLLVSNNKLNR